LKFKFTHKVHPSARRNYCTSNCTQMQLCCAHSSQIFWIWVWKIPFLSMLFVWENFPTG